MDHKRIYHNVILLSATVWNKNTYFCLIHFDQATINFWPGRNSTDVPKLVGVFSKEASFHLQQKFSILNTVILCTKDKKSFLQFLCPSSGVFFFLLYTQQWYMSYRFADSVQAGSGWNCSSILSILIPLARCLQTCMTYIIAVCTVKNSWWWTEELSETCRVSFQE